MNREILLFINHLKESYNGDPWFGRSIQALLSEVGEGIAFEKPDDQHSILELLWHMVLWRRFVLSRLGADEESSVDYFEINDWQELDHRDKGLWEKGLQQLEATQASLVSLLNQQDDSILEEKVSGRPYNFRQLLHGIVQHDIYHLGQIAYITKLLKHNK